MVWVFFFLQVCTKNDDACKTAFKMIQLYLENNNIAW